MIRKISLKYAFSSKYYINMYSKIIHTLTMFFYISNKYLIFSFFIDD